MALLASNSALSHARRAAVFSFASIAIVLCVAERLAV
jgi:hypothetical protein